MNLLEFYIWPEKNALSQNMHQAQTYQRLDLHGLRKSHEQIPIPGEDNTAITMKNNSC